MTSNLTTLLRHNVALAWTCLAITMKADAASDRILFDFQTATNHSAWQIVNDDVMGGVSTSRFQILTTGGAVFSGVVSLENNGGFASVRSQPVRADLTGCDSFLLRVRGDGRATSSPSAPRPDWTHRFTNWVSRRSAANGRNIGCHSRISCRHFAVAS